MIARILEKNHNVIEDCVHGNCERTACSNSGNRSKRVLLASDVNTVRSWPLANLDYLLRFVCSRPITDTTQCLIGPGKVQFEM